MIEQKKIANESWKYFTNGVGSDILLFQEAVPNFNVLNKENPVWSEIGGTRKWGSGIYRPKYTINPFPFTNNFPGAVTAAEIELHDNLNIYSYDAYLIQCAQQTGTSLLTLDRGLREATKKTGIHIIEV